MTRRRAPARPATHRQAARHQIREHTDKETGVAKQSRTIVSAVPPQGDEMAIERVFFQHSILGGTSLNYVIGPWLDALRAGRWQPSNAKELRTVLAALRRAIAVARRLLPSEYADAAEHVGVMGFRAGALWQEAIAKEKWPITRHGRSAQTGRSSGRQSPKRRRASAELLAKLEAMQKGRLSFAAVARRYLAEDPAWDALEQDEQDRKVHSLLRRLSHAKKNRRLKKTDDVR